MMGGEDPSPASPTRPGIPSSPPPAYTSNDDQARPDDSVAATPAGQDAQHLLNEHSTPQSGLVPGSETPADSSTTASSGLDDQVPSSPRKRVASTADPRPDSKRSTNSQTSAGQSSSSTASIPPSPHENAVSLGDPSLLRSASSVRPQPMSPSRASSYTLPIWQPDRDVYVCPVCQVAFGWLNRKHHCRRCGRVVCASCSPHRITIPRQYIVSLPRSAIVGTPDPSFPFNLGGGEVVRVCNPCVPDPNPNPPQLTSTRSPRSLPQIPTSNQAYPTQNGFDEPTMTLREALDPRSGIPRLGLANMLRQQPFAPSAPDFHTQSQSTSNAHAASHTLSYPTSSLREPAPEPVLRSNSHSISARRAQAMALSSRYRELGARRQPGNSQQEDEEWWMIRGQGWPARSAAPGEAGTRETGTLSEPTDASSHSITAAGDLISASASASPRTPCVPRRRIPEEDQCPICSRELPPKGPGGDETVREVHVEDCIRNASLRLSFPTPPHGPEGFGPMPPYAPPNSLNSESVYYYEAMASRMFTYRATEKDCTSGDGTARECIICLGDLEVGEEMARLECLCSFHKGCITEWWKARGPGRCPTHQIQY